MSHSGIQKLVKTAYESAGLATGKNGYSTHSLRHSFATALLKESGGNLKVVQECLRHASLSSTSIYAQVPIEEMATRLKGLS